MVIPELLRALSHQLVLEVASHNEWLAAAECGSSSDATGGWAAEAAANPSLSSLSSMGADLASCSTTAAAAAAEEEEEEEQQLQALARAWGR